MKLGEYQSIPVLTLPEISVELSVAELHGG